MVYNPAYSVVSLYQKAIAFQQLDFDTGLFLPISVAALLLIIGFFLFIRASSDIVDAL
jgi:ABC-type polysaccharide/polyol phosphate export permease